MNEKLPGTKVVAQRCENAYTNFIEICAEHGFTSEQAKHIFTVYTRLKVIRLDANIGRYQFTHGVFVETASMHNALAQPLVEDRRRKSVCKFCGDTISRFATTDVWSHDYEPNDREHVAVPFPKQ